MRINPSIEQIPQRQPAQTCPAFTFPVLIPFLQNGLQIWEKRGRGVGAAPAGVNPVKSL